MLGPEISEKLKAVGVELHRDVMTAGLLWPIAAIHHKSEEPTDEEVALLGSFVRRKLGVPEDAPIERFGVEGFNTVTFRKEGRNRWTFRLLTWAERMWCPRSNPLEKTLQEV